MKSGYNGFFGGEDSKPSIPQNVFRGGRIPMRKRMPVLFLSIFLVAFLSAQTTGQVQKFEPTVGQPGKDVIWVPTPFSLIEAMLDMAKATPADYLIDLGAGDGRIAIAAAKRGIRALGIEYNPDMAELCRENAAKDGVSAKAEFRQADIFETDFSGATVLTMYLLPSLNMKLRPTILEMKPGTRVVTHSFLMEDWEPDQSVAVEGRSAYLWIVPAKVEGEWVWAENGGEAVLTLTRTFQKIGGNLKVGSRESSLKNPLLEGDRITFSIDGNPTGTREFSGRVNGDVIRGSMKGSDGKTVEWSAKRKAA
jgi:phospholipid N-methyltransferase